MELGSQSSLGVELEQEEDSTNLDKSVNIDPSIDCQNEMEGTVIIYDSDAQGETIVNVVTNSEATNNLISLRDSDDPDNMITLHASTCDTKNDICEEAICSTNVDNLKSDVLNKTAEPEVESDDDETIATFITSTGQQLALYAVEDSDEIFAVALYDESGEPPSNFHFLMKADVERLIGEGAVKTVKKPPLQQNKEPRPRDKREEIIYETYEESKRRFERAEELKKKAEIKANAAKVQKVQSIQKKKIQNIDQRNTNIVKSVNNKSIHAKKQTNLTKTNKSISNISQPRFDKKKETTISYIISSENESYIYDHLQDEIDSDAEIIEQSTVQYILCDGDNSDSELTFDELQASLKSFKTGKPTMKPNKMKPAELQKHERKKDPNSKFILKNNPNVTTIIYQKKEPTTTIYRTYKNVKKPRLSNNLLQEQKNLKADMEDPSLSDFSTFEDGPNSSDELLQNDKQDSIIVENSSSIVKVKRSRKQQLTVVNRTDSEIIIQPASVFSEEEEEPVVTKKRGRRKKKLLPDPDYHPRKPSRRTRRTNRSVEIIEIDVDENDRSNILEITLDGKKGKGSSDKENDIISLDDSDDSEDLSKKSKKPVMQCSHCMRNFRKRRALERHVQICEKSPLNLQKIEERKRRMMGKGKKFKCKSCSEFFDIALALARHVRAVHSPRKRGRPPKSNWLRDDGSDSFEIDDSMDESTPEPEREPKRRGRPRLKRSLSKDQSPTPEIELKLDSSLEASTEPRRRGRPPKKKLSKERSISPDSVEKRANSLESTTRSMIAESASEPRKRGRPSKKSISKERVSVTPDPKDRSDNLSEQSLQIPKKRGRPSKRTLSKDERSPTPETEDKNEYLTDSASEPRKRGRPSKPNVSSDKRSESPEIIVKIEVLSESNTNDETTSPDFELEKIEDSPELESEPRKKFRSIKDEKELVSVDEASVTSELEENLDKPVESPTEDADGKKGKPDKDKCSKDEDSVHLDVEVKVENLSESPSESRKKGKPNKDGSSHDERSVTPEIQTEQTETEEQKSESQEISVVADEERDSVKPKKKIPSPNRTWKVKKLNCADCGKWFSSAAALTTHRLQHRTKTSGHLAHRCPFCKKFIPLELFSKHLSIVHGKPVSEKASGSRSVHRNRTRRVHARVAKTWSSRTLRSSN